MTEKQTETNVGKYECVCGRRTGGSPASGSVEYRWFSLHFSATTLCSAPIHIHTKKYNTLHEQTTHSLVRRCVRV